MPNVYQIIVPPNRAGSKRVISVVKTKLLKTLSSTAQIVRFVEYRYAETIVLSDITINPHPYAGNALVTTPDVSASAPNNEHIKRIKPDDERHTDIDRAESVLAHAVTDEYAVYNRKEKKQTCPIIAGRIYLKRFLFLAFISEFTP